MWRREKKRENGKREPDTLEIEWATCLCDTMLFPQLGQWPNHGPYVCRYTYVCVHTYTPVLSQSVSMKHTFVAHTFQPFAHLIRLPFGHIDIRHDRIADTHSRARNTKTVLTARSRLSHFSLASSMSDDPAA